MHLFALRIHSVWLLVIAQRFIRTFLLPVHDMRFLDIGSIFWLEDLDLVPELFQSYSAEFNGNAGLYCSPEKHCYCRVYFLSNSVYYPQKADIHRSSLHRTCCQVFFYPILLVCCLAVIYLLLLHIVKFLDSFQCTFSVTLSSVLRLLIFASDGILKTLNC